MRTDKSDGCPTWFLLSLIFHPMDQAVAKKTLQELIKREDLKNKICADCPNPNPQWASLRCAGRHSCAPRLSHLTSHTSFAIFLCLQCAGTHRGFGVHVRCAVPDSSLLVVGVHVIRQLRPISLDGYMAGGAGETNDREPHPKGSERFFLTNPCSWEETGRS